MATITQLNSKSLLLSGDYISIVDISDTTMSLSGSNKKMTAKRLADSLTTIFTDGSLSGKTIAAGAITADKIAAGAITADKIAAGAITGGSIAAGTITADKLAVGVITAGSIAANSITTITLQASSITADKIAANTITADKIAANTITADKIAANTITANQIAANSITTITLQASSITANKISAGAIASNSMLASNIIAANNLVTDFVLTKNIQSDNFNGQISNNYSSTNSITSRTLNVGTSGYYLDSQSGTIVASKFIARDGIIAGNYIKYNNNGAFEVDAQGNLGVKVDQDTLAISNGSLVIKQVPSTSIVVATKDINYLGGLNTTAYNNLTCSHPGTANSTFNSPQNIWCVYDSLNNVQSVLNITAVDLYNVSFTVNYANVVNLANASNIFFGIVAKWSDQPTATVNTPVGYGGGGYFAALNNPVLPLGPVTYTIPKITVSVTTTPTNRYLIIAPHMGLFGSNMSGTIGISAASTINTSLIIKASGQITSPNNAFSSLVRSSGSIINMQP